MAAKRRTKKARKGLPYNRPCGNTLDGTTLVQSLVFSKDKHLRGKPKWSPKLAKKWAKSHGYVSSNIDEKPNTYRIRQFDPGACEYRTVPFGKSGIQAVIETPERRAAGPVHVLREVEAELASRDVKRKR